MFKTDQFLQMKFLGLFRWARVLIVCLAAAGSAITLVGCGGSTDIHHSGDASDEYENMPWSRPEAWEGSAGFGGFGQQN